MAQSGSALRSGRRGPRFESGHPDLNINVGAWRSPVARFNGVEEVVGSNPIAPTIPALVAQQVEHFLGKEEVTGSSPVEGLKISPKWWDFLFFTPHSSRITYPANNAFPKVPAGGVLHVPP